MKTAAAGPVTIEILNASGATVRRFSSADPAPPVDPNTLAVNAIWQRAQDPPSAAAGMHRFVWDLRPEAPPGGAVAAAAAAVAAAEDAAACRRFPPARSPSS